MKNLNIYINEAWNGVKKQSYEQEIKSWCEEMGIKNYTINSKGEIDVDGDVNLMHEKFKELPYKFGKVSGYFDVSYNENLVSLEGCPKEVSGRFCCSNCRRLDSLEGCPKEVGGNFVCINCKRKFKKEEVKSLCKIKEYIYL